IRRHVICSHENFLSMRITRLRLQIRLRTFLILVALLALGVFGWKMWRRRQYCLEMAAYYDGSPAYFFPKHGRPKRLTSLILTYRHVADHPWLPLPREPQR